MLGVDHAVRLLCSLICACSEKMLKLAISAGRDELISFGTCFGKFTKSSKFRLHITALDYLAQYALVHFLNTPLSHLLLCLTV